MNESIRSQEADCRSDSGGAGLRAALGRKLSSILEYEMRCHKALEMLESAPPDDVYCLVREVFVEAVEPGEPVRLLRDVLLDLLAEEGAGATGRSLSYALRREVYEIAAQQDDQASMRLLRSQRGNEALEDREVRLPKELQDLALGMRRSLAKGNDPRRLEVLGRDPDPIVIRNLLRNPQLREEDVVRIAALRPVAPTTLCEIAKCARWNRQPRIRVALARNPHTPVELGVKMVASIPLADLRAMQRDPGLHPETMRQVEGELARRAPAS